MYRMGIFKGNEWDISGGWVCQAYFRGNNKRRLELVTVSVFLYTPVPHVCILVSVSGANSSLYIAKNCQ